MSHLPQELVTNILARLLVKDLVRFLCVSKLWYALINDSDFIKMHLNHSIETNRDRTLILQELSYDYGLEEFAIWNPLVRKYRKLPIEPIEEPSGFSGGTIPNLAFAPDLNNDDYKVLRESILAFDLATEKFWLSRIPIKPDYNWVTSLEVLGGYGLACVSNKPKTKAQSWLIFREAYIEFWLMNKYGVGSSWIWIFKIEHGVVHRNFDSFKPVMFSKNGKKVLLEERGLDHHTYLIWYDIEKKSCEMIKNWRVKSRSFPCVFRMVTCIGSLLLLDGDGDGVIDVRQKKNKRRQKKNKRKR
ncbi:hypothetical protein ACB092_05G146000 [Castanea dentata]